MASKLKDRVYKTRHDNEARDFIKGLNPMGTLRETYELLGVTYECFFYSFKNNSISKRLKNRIVEKCALSPQQEEQLRFLVFKEKDAARPKM